MQSKDFLKFTILSAVSYQQKKITESTESISGPYTFNWLITKFRVETSIFTPVLDSNSYRMSFTQIFNQVSEGLLFTIDDYVINEVFSHICA